MKKTLLALAAIAMLGAVWFAYTNSHIWGLYRAVRALDGKAASMSGGTAAGGAGKAARTSGGPDGFVYRFDDGFKEARLDGGGRPVPERYRTRVLIGGDACLLKTNRGILERTGKGVRLRFTAGQFLYNAAEKEPLGIRKVDLASVVVRARHRRGTKMSIYFNQDVEGGEFKPAAVVDVLPDGEFHDYVVDAGKLPEAFAYLNGLAVKPSNVEDDEVEIASVEAVSAREGYLKDTAGVASREMGGEIRPCLFMRGGSTLRYRLDTAGREGLALRFGLAAMDGSGPVGLTVERSVDGGKATLFTENAVSGGGWRDVSVPFPDMPGGAEVVFRAAGDPDGVVFISNPEISGPPKKPMRVIWYVEDAERADHLSVYGYARETTPFKEALAREGALFENAYSQGAKTGISCSSFFTGLYPTAEGVWDNNSAGLPDEYTTIAEMLRARGFETASFIQNYFAGATLGLDQGFCTVRTMVGEPASATVPKALEWLRGHRDRNVFVYVHILNPHAPYEPEGPYDRWYRESPGTTPVERDERIDPAHVAEPTAEGRAALYDGEIRANDEEFGRFVAGLKEAGLYGDTLLIFASDHGEYLGEEGYWEHRPPCLRPVLRVPLIMVYPGRIRPGVQVSQNVQLIDVMPTVLDYAGMEPEAFPLQGDSLAGLIEGRDGEFWDGRIIFADEVSTRKGKADRAARGSAFYKGFQYTVMRNTAGPVEWLSVDGAAPGRVDGIGSRLTAGLLSRALDASQRTSLGIWERTTRGREKEKREDQKTREQLKALGYLH